MIVSLSETSTLGVFSLSLWGGDEGACTYMHVCANMYSFMCVLYVQKPEISVPHLTPPLSILISRLDLSLNLELLAKLADQQDPWHLPISTSPALELKESHRA